MAETVNIQKGYSALNAALTKLFDESGVKRSFTVPYIEGQEMHEHISTVGQAASQAGGLTKNFVTTGHHSTGKGWGSGDGHTVGHPADKLRSTIIPKDDKNAIAAIAAAQKQLDNVACLVGDDDPSVKTSNAQLALVKKTDGAGMNLLDFGVMLIQLMYRPTQAVARAHQGTKKGGHSPKLTGPEASAAPQDGAESQEGAQEEAPAAQGAPAAAAASVPQAAPATAPAAPQGQ